MFCQILGLYVVFFVDSSNSMIYSIVVFFFFLFYICFGSYISKIKLLIHLSCRIW
jgi:hypothetical protein